MSFTPYYIALELPDAASTALPIQENHQFRPLSADDMQIVSSLPDNERDLDSLLKRLEESRCFGIFFNGALAGYSWAKFSRFTSVLGRIELHELESNEAYLFDMYIAKAFRGAEFAPFLRQQVYETLRSESIVRYYSITTYFNRPSQRFKSKLGARHIELRFALRVGPFLALDFRVSRFEDDVPFKPKRFYLIWGEDRN